MPAHSAQGKVKYSKELKRIENREPKIKKTGICD